ncbi:MAG: GH3 auxin-responsive promoter family protein [Muribaculaceae bacterium]|nr:GH3 auxin-responsive promoter family protein [Muribaculaceae bacterium]
MNYTPLARLIFRHRAHRTDLWGADTHRIQLNQLRRLLSRGASTEFGRTHGFEDILNSADPRETFARSVPAAGYEDFRPMVLRMMDGERDVLWPGGCMNYARSSGTSGGPSKFIPVTGDSLRINHFAGSADVVAQYLRYYPESRLFSGKAMILGGSFDPRPRQPGVKVGDLSASLIDSIPAMGNMFRVPDKKTALLPDWNEKLDLMAKAAVRAPLTNISGVPSWFLRVLLRALEISGHTYGHDLWPHMEVFFHGGIRFEPYRSEYDSIFDPSRMHYFETYNASEGFFATQAARENDGMLLLIDNGVYYEFMPLGAEGDTRALGAHELTPGHVYEMIITSCNGLWRYRIGDTVEVVSQNPLRIRVAGRTRSFINAFGEELMESNAETAVAEATRLTGAAVRNYTAGPLYARGNRKGRHQWLFEWDVPPADTRLFAKTLDKALKSVNTDYAAKREGDIFLDMPEIVTLPSGSFDRWLSTHGNGKLGGQRKIPRLHNDRTIIDSLLCASGIEDD